VVFSFISLFFLGATYTHSISQGIEYSQPQRKDNRDFGMVQSWVAASKPALSEVEWAQLGDGKSPKAV